MLRPCEINISAEDITSLSNYSDGRHMTTSEFVAD